MSRARTMNALRGELIDDSIELSLAELRRVRRAQRLQRDLGVNTPGIALALELLEEVESLRARLRRFDLEAT